MSSTTAQRRKLKILHFMPENFVWGGIETYLNLMLPRLATNQEYDITAVVTKDGQLYENLKAAGVKVHGLSFPFKKRSLFRSAWVNPLGRLIDLSVYMRLIPFLKQEKPDLIHIHNGMIEQSLIALAGFPMVMTYHGYGGIFNIEGAPTPLYKKVNTFLRPLVAGAFPFLSGMLVVSDYERRRLYREQYLAKDFKAEVLHNGIPTEDLTARADKTDRLKVRREVFGLSQEVAENTRVVSYSCRLTQERNPLAVLRIAKKVLQNKRLNKPVYFVVAGEGKMAGEFEHAFAHDPVLASNGRYLGFRNDIPEIITASDLTINTSPQEGFGLRVLESLIFGRPCITYATGGIPEVMDLPLAQSWLIPLHEEDAFAERVVDILNMSDDNLQALAPVLQTHGKGFDISTHIERLLGFYGRTFQKLGLEAEKPAEQPTEKTTEISTTPLPAIKPPVSIS